MSTNSSNPILPPDRDDGNQSFTTVTVTVNEAAKILGVSEPTVYRLVSRRLLKILPGLRHKRITRRSLDAYSSGVVTD